MYVINRFVDIHGLTHRLELFFRKILMDVLRGMRWTLFLKWVDQPSQHTSIIISSSEIFYYGFSIQIGDAASQHGQEL